MKKKMTALFISVNMTLALYGCGSQPATPVAEQNQTENSESLYDEDVVVEVSTADEESSDDTKEENMDNDSGDLSEDSTVLDSDDAEESDEAEGPDEDNEGSSAFFDLGFMSFELPADWEIDEHKSSPENDEYYLALYGDIYITGMDISIMHMDIDDEPEMVNMMLESEDAVLEEYMLSELSDEIFSNNISIKKLSQTFIGKTREISLEMSGVEDEYSTMSIIYLGLANDDVYGIALHIFNDATYEDVYIQDGMAAIDMLFETGELLK